MPQSTEHDQFGFRADQAVFGEAFSRRPVKVIYPQSVAALIINSTRSNGKVILTACLAPHLSRPSAEYPDQTPQPAVQTAEPNIVEPEQASAAVAVTVTDQTSAAMSEPPLHLTARVRSSWQHAESVFKVFI